MRLRVAVSPLLLCAVAAGLRAQGDEPYPLPKPKAASPARDEGATAELAKRLCEAIDARDATAVAKALADGADANQGMGAGSDSTAGRTPLIHATLVGDTNLVDQLLAAGARLERGDDAGHTPLMYAVLTSRLDVAKHLARRGARLDTQDKEGSTASAYVKAGAEEIATWLAATETLHTGLLAALQANDLPRAWQQIEAGASPNTHDDKTSFLLAAVQAADVERVKQALAGGCRPDLLLTRSFTIETPLGVAAAKGSLELLRLLLAAGKPNQLAADDALANAAGSTLPDRAERVKLLLAAGADAATETLLQTPLANAARRADLPTMSLLLAAGADQNAANHALGSACDADSEAQILAVVRALLAIGADANHDYLFTTPVGDAAQRGQVRVLELLAPHASDETLSSAVAQAARAGNAVGLKWLCDHGGKRIDFAWKPGLYDASLNAAITNGHHECLAILITAGADVNTEPQTLDNTPLLTAVARKDQRAIEMLLAAGADPTKQWDRGLLGKESALGKAKQDGDESIVALLTAAAAKTRDPLGTTLLATPLTNKELPRFYELRYTNRDSGRGQAVYLRKAVDSYESLRVQEAYSLCYDRPEAPGSELLRTAFQKRFGVGGLVLEAPSEAQPNWRIRFRVTVPCDAAGDRLVELLSIVQSTADSLEQELNPGAEDRL